MNREPFYGENEIIGGFGGPSCEVVGALQGIEGAVDLDGGENSGGVGELALVREFCGIKYAAPGFVPPAGDSDADFSWSGGHMIPQARSLSPQRDSPWPVFFTALAVRGAALGGHEAPPSSDWYALRTNRAKRAGKSARATKCVASDAGWPIGRSACPGAGSAQSAQARVPALPKLREHMGLRQFGAADFGGIEFPPGSASFIAAPLSVACIFYRTRRAGREPGRPLFFSPRLRLVWAC